MWSFSWLCLTLQDRADGDMQSVCEVRLPFIQFIVAASVADSVRSLDSTDCRHHLLQLEIMLAHHAQGGTPYTEVCMYVPPNAPVFGHFSLSVRRKNVNFLSLCPN